MKLIEYLKEKYDPAGAGYCLSRKEAKILGISWPLKKGWLKVHGQREIGLVETQLRQAASKYFSRTHSLRNADGLSDEQREHLTSIMTR